VPAARPSRPGGPGLSARTGCRQAALEGHKDPATLRFGGWQAGQGSPGRAPGSRQEHPARTPLRACGANGPAQNIRGRRSSTPSASPLGPWNCTLAGRRTQPVRRFRMKESWPVCLPAPDASHVGSLLSCRGSPRRTRDRQFPTKYVGQAGRRDRCASLQDFGFHSS